MLKSCFDALRGLPLLLLCPSDAGAGSASTAGLLTVFFGGLPLRSLFLLDCLPLRFGFRFCQDTIHHHSSNNLIRLYSDICEI